MFINIFYIVLQAFFPDTINQPKFKSPILKAGENYLSSIVMRLGNDF